MFYVHPTRVGTVKKSLGVVSNNQRKLTGEKKAIRDRMWAAFCKGVVGGGDTAPEPQKEEKAPVVIQCPDELEKDALTPVESERKYLELGKISAEFTGPFNLESLASWLAMLPVKGTDEVRIRVEMEKV